MASVSKWLALLVVGLGTIAAVLATTSFNVAVPALSKHFGLGQDQVQWAITGFPRLLTVAMLPTPWLLDQVGFRRLFLGANLMLGITRPGVVRWGACSGETLASWSPCVCCRGWRPGSCSPCPCWR